MSSVEEANGPAAPDKFTEASYAPVLPKKVAARKDVWFISAPADVSAADTDLCAMGGLARAPPDAIPPNSLTCTGSRT